MEHVIKHLYRQTLAASLIGHTYMELAILELLDRYKLLEYIPCLHFSVLDQTLTLKVNDYAAYEFFLFMDYLTQPLSFESRLHPYSSRPMSPSQMCRLVRRLLMFSP